MDNYYLSIKIIKYLDYFEFYQASQVSTNWKKAARYLIYSIPCDLCHKKGIKMWRRMKLFVDNNPEYHCLECMTKLDYHLIDYSPAIPLKSGQSKICWYTSDVPLIWSSLWWFILSNNCIIS